jgi:hypothetical protein
MLPPEANPEARRAGRLHAEVRAGVREAPAGDRVEQAGQVAGVVTIPDDRISRADHQCTPPMPSADREATCPGSTSNGSARHSSHRSRCVIHRRPHQNVWLRRPIHGPIRSPSWSSSSRSSRCAAARWSSPGSSPPPGGDHQVVPASSSAKRTSSVLPAASTTRQRTASRTGGTATSSGTSTASVPARQSGNRVTSPDGDTSAASPGKSSSSVDPAWVAMATHTPSRRAWRTASPTSPLRTHQACPSRQPAWSLRRR